MYSHAQLLTGATGVVGCHILHSLIQRPHVHKVYCLIRVKKSAPASKRLDDVLATNHLLDIIPPEQHRKIVTIDYDLYNADGRLGLSDKDYATLRSSVTTICHNAWAVNFNMDLDAFEPHCRGTYDLINLGLQSFRKKKPTFVFVSTAGAVTRVWPPPAMETLHDFEACNGAVNYSIAKWITERVCHTAGEKTILNVRIVRLGQICGDVKHGMWNTKEAWPMLMATSRTIGYLPVNTKFDQDHYWLPSDVTGAAFVDISLLDQVDEKKRASVPKFSIFHIANSQPVAWKGTVIQSLRRHGLEFETIPWAEWMQRVEESDSNVIRNPPYRLRGFFRGLVEQNGDEIPEVAHPAWALDMTISRQFSPRLVKGVVLDDELIGKFVKYWVTQPGWTGQSYPAKM